MRILGYFFDQYLVYAMSCAVRRLLFAYIPMSAFSLVGVAGGQDLGELTASITDPFPRKSMAAASAPAGVLASVLEEGSQGW